MLERGGVAPTELDASPQLALLRAVFDATLQQAIVVSDLGGRVIAWNQQARRAFGYDAAEVLGTQAPHFLDAAALAAGELERVLAEVRAKGRWSGPLTAARKDGTRLLATVTITGLRDDAGQWLGEAWSVSEGGAGASSQAQALVQAREQELAKALQRIEQNERDARKALSDLTHDLRTPLNGIIGFAELMKADSDALCDEHAEYLADILESAKHMLELITQLRGRTGQHSPGR